MKTYDPLASFLSRQSDSAVAMSFEEIEHVLGVKLPASAYGRNEWWSNNTLGHSQAKAWLGAGFLASNLDRKRKTVVFRRIADQQFGHHGMSDEDRAFRTDDAMVSQHPAFGAMKGTFRIEPADYDLTQPAYGEEEWAGIQEEILAKFDRQFGSDAK